MLYLMSDSVLKVGDVTNFILGKYRTGSSGEECLVSYLSVCLSTNHPM